MYFPGYAPVHSSPSLTRVLGSTAVTDRELPQQRNRLKLQPALSQALPSVPFPDQYFNVPAAPPAAATVPYAGLRNGSSGPVGPRAGHDRATCL